jgi:transcriptional regulator with PAS, ATPase and Fis domain
MVSAVVRSGSFDTFSTEDLKEMDLNKRIETIEKREILKALDESRGNKSQAARLLGISRFTLQRKIDKYGLLHGGK